MRIDCYMSLQCASEEKLRQNITEALSLEKGKAEVNYYHVSDEQAQSLGLRGSPSVLINGKDIQPAEITGFS